VVPGPPVRTPARGGCRRHRPLGRAGSRRQAVRQAVALTSSCGATAPSREKAWSYAVRSMPPQIRYARSGSVNVAYQVAGEGPADVLMIPGWVTHLALDWHEPRWVAWFERMAAFARAVRFAKRGTGM